MEFVQCLHVGLGVDDFGEGAGACGSGGQRVSGDERRDGLAGGEVEETEPDCRRDPAGFGECADDGLWTADGARCGAGAGSTRASRARLARVGGHCG